MCLLFTIRPSSQPRARHNKTITHSHPQPLTPPPPTCLMYQLLAMTATNQVTVPETFILGATQILGGHKTYLRKALYNAIKIGLNH